MSTIDTTFDFNKFVDEIEVTPEGKGKISINGLSRMVGVSRQTLAKDHFKGVMENPSKMARSLISAGFEPVKFAKEGIPDLAAAIVIEYYAMDAGGRCTNLAKAALRSFTAVGIRRFFQSVKGWESDTINPQPVHPVHDLSEARLQLLKSEAEVHFKFGTAYQNLGQALEFHYTEKIKAESSHKKMKAKGYCSPGQLDLMQLFDQQVQEISDTFKSQAPIALSVPASKFSGTAVAEKPVNLSESEQDCEDFKRIEVRSINGTNYFRVGQLVAMATNNQLTSDKGYGTHLSSELRETFPELLYSEEEIGRNRVQMRHYFAVSDQLLNFIRDDIENYPRPIVPTVEQCMIYGVPFNADEQTPSVVPDRFTSQSQRVFIQPQGRKGSVDIRRGKISTWVQIKVRKILGANSTSEKVDEATRKVRNEFYDFARTKIPNLPRDKGLHASFMDAVEDAGLLNSLFSVAHTYFRRAKHA